MTDPHLDRWVRDADPYRPEAVGRVGAAKQALLEEIMSEPGNDHAPRWRAWTRSVRVRRVVGALAAATAVAGVFTLPAVLRDQPDDHGSAQGAALAFPPGALQAAEDNPRLLIDEPGWKATHVYGFAEQAGTIAFDNGGRQLEMKSVPGRPVRRLLQGSARGQRPRAGRGRWPAG